MSLLAAAAPGALAQGSRKDDIVFGPAGHPVAGATVRVCQTGAIGTPCGPLATLYTDATLKTTAPNPLQTDGIGNYHFYAPAGRYLIQITGQGITGTETYPDVILPPDVSSTGSGNNISAFGLSLGGNLSVGGNATIAGTLTTANFSPGSFTPSSLAVSGSASIAGPRPYIDVTAPPYNATGNPSGNDAAAIQAAITAACSTTINSATYPYARPAVYFPPGRYSVTQTQTGTSATAPIFTTCPNLELIGAEGQAGTGQFQAPPQATIAVNAGASPNGAPVFQFIGTNTGATNQEQMVIKNLAINGYNEAVWVQSTGQIWFVNDYLTSQDTSGGVGGFDNVPLKISNSEWVWMKGGGLQTSTGANYTLLMTGETALHGEIIGVGIVSLEDVITNGGGFEYIQRASTPQIPGDFIFSNVIQENVNTPFLTISNTSPGLAGGYGNISFFHSAQADGSGGAMLLFNAAGSYLQSPMFWNSVPGTTNARGVMVQAGTLRNTISFGSLGAPSDASGNPQGGGLLDGDEAGIDLLSPASSQPCTDYFAIFCSQSNFATRWFSAGNTISGLGLDSSYGVQFGDQATHGYSAALKQAAVGTLDLQTASLLPPTSFGGTATTGGSLAAGTYYAVLYSVNGNTVSTCASAGNISTFAYASPVSISGSNNAINFTWTAPQNTRLPVGGYCLYVGTANPRVAGLSKVLLASGGSSSLLYTGQPLTSVGPIQPISYMVSAHRFTYNSLGVNTTSPAYNLDVNGSAAVNSLNGVQKAERFAGSDAAAQINNCLTAASSSSGVCDARGLTGTYTATHHISIPARTALLWCQGKLTISDTGTNDAVELGGDGAAIYGCGEAGSGRVPRPQTSGYLACGIAGCTVVDNPNAASANVDWIHIDKMYLQATGANSTVVNLTSVGHTDLENNRFVLGTGGGSYGIYGNTSSGNQDSTNSLIKHNEFDAQSQNDTCLYLAGVFNSIKTEQNSCYLPASNTGTIGFALAKDTNGNYPDNDEFDANDCEAATTSFGQICFNLVGAQNVQIGPTNRCENVYNCIQFPSDGSAVGNHMIDPYLSLSVNTMVKPNEPAAAQQAMDNTGTNWQPSFHYGLSDLGGTNLLSNAGFEGWSNTTTLFGWGGVSGTNINRAGSGIYAQQLSAASPTDGTTQGLYSVKIGDNATAGLGINSACIQVDSTMNYTLAFRVASTSASVKFRPGFRFYSDANCTEADRITSVATNARVLQPAYYGGTSALAGTGANWQSTNASLTYNNGITCNCSVTGADWSVSTASTWTPTRNFAITFRAPNTFSNASTVAQSMRVFILENTAANPNQIWLDDIALSQGPVNTKIPHTAAVAENGACVGCGINTVSSYSIGTVTSGQAPGATNQVDLSVIYLPNVTFSHVTVDVSTADPSTGDFYSWAITDTAGNVKCSMSAAVNLTATGVNQQACSQGTVTLANGNYLFAFTGNATTGKIAYSGTAPLALSTAVAGSTSSSGVITFPVTLPTAGQTFSSYGLPAILLN